MKIKGALLFAAWLLLGVGTIGAQTIIVNPSVNITTISKSDIHDIFLGSSTHFENGSQAIPVTLKGGEVHEAFLKNYIGKNDFAFRAAWRSIVFAGQGIMPRVFDTQAELIEYVASVPGAIGYVNSVVSTHKVKSLTVK